MPVGSRIRANNVFGVTTDNPLTAGSSTYNSAQLALMPAIAGNHAVVTLDPLRQFGEPEIVVITVHTALATVATITRGTYGTVARSHPINTVWVHAPVDEDVIEILTSATRPTDPYQGEMIYETDTDRYVGRRSGSWRDVLPMGSWPTWTPTITQAVGVTFTNVRSTHTQLGSLAIVQFSLTVTGAGGTTNNILFIGNLPITAASAAGGLINGFGFIYDASTTIRYGGEWFLDTTTRVGFVGDWSGPAPWGVIPNLPIQVNDLIQGVLIYEVA